MIVIRRTPDSRKKNFRLVEKIIEEKKNANFINIVHHVPILLQNEPPAVEVSLPDGATMLKWNFYEDEDPKKYYRGEVVIEDSDKFYSGEVNISDLERLGRTKAPTNAKSTGRHTASTALSFRLTSGSAIIMSSFRILTRTAWKSCRRQG